MNKQNTLKIEVLDKAIVGDMFLSFKKKIERVLHSLSYIYKILSIEKVATLTWQPAMARCPADEFNFNNVFNTAIFS